MKKLLIILSLILLTSCSDSAYDNDYIQKIDSVCAYDTRTKIVYYINSSYGGYRSLTPTFNSKGEPMKYEDYINKKF